MTTRYMYGKTAHKRVDTAMLASLITLPPAAESWKGPNDAGFDYGMLDNDTLGDCTFAGVVHLTMAICLLLGVTPPDPTGDAVGQAYLAFTHGQDTGCAMTDVLSALVKTGILGVDVVGWAPCNDTLPELWSIVQTFGAAYIGSQMPAIAQQQFGAGDPWDLTDTTEDNNIEGGHCTVVVAFDQAAEMAQLITWGRRQLVTFRWLARYMDESYAVIPRQVETAGSLDGMNWAALQTAMSALR
jgi:hypothetical protein